MMQTVFSRNRVTAIFCLLSSYCFAQQPLHRHDSLPIRADTLSFRSGSLQLKGLLWKPEGAGPFPAVLFNHGSEDNSDHYAHRLAGVFVQKGYAFFMPFRRGQGLSVGQGRYIRDFIDSLSRAAAGPQNDTIAAIKARSIKAIELHRTEQLQDQLAGLNALLQQKQIDKNRVAVAGISFGGIQTMLMAAQKTRLKCAVNFAGSAMMWDGSPDVQQWMKDVAAEARIPVMFVQAENDFSIQPSIQMAGVMKEKGLPHELKIYPPNGTTKMQGHAFVIRGTAWMPEVFRFLETHMAR